MIVIGIDSSTEILSIGIADENTVIGEKEVESQREHASRIIGAIDEVLSAASFSKSNLSGVAVATGPGSFTGLRVGLAVAKGMAVALNIPIVGISTFEVVGRRLGNEYEELCLISSARKGEFYFTRISRGVKITKAIELVDSASLSKKVGRQHWGFLGQARDDINLSTQHRIPPQLLTVSGGKLALYGARLIKDGRIDNPETLEPLYYAHSQAERKFGRK